MNNVIEILGDRWTYVYSSMYYGTWGYDKENNMLSTTNSVSFSPEELQAKINEVENNLNLPNPDPASVYALEYLRKIQDKIG